MLKKSVEKRISFIVLIIINAFTIVAQNSTQVQLANEYYQNGDILKARDIYDQLAKDPKNYLDIHNNYFELLIQQKDFKAVDKYLKKAEKAFPMDIYYKIDRARLYQSMGDMNLYTKYVNDLIERFKSSEYQVRLGTKHMLSKQMSQEAIKMYKASRAAVKDETKYALEMANVYRQLDQKDNMIGEYLNFASLRPGNLRYVKNILQTVLQDQEYMEAFQAILIEKIQKNPNISMYGDLLVWVNIQRKDFYAAFIQAKALDKRFKEDGFRLMQIGDLAMENKLYDDAISIFSYIIEKYTVGNVYSTSKRKIIQARESKIKTEFPIDKNAIHQLTLDYQNLIKELGLNNSTYDAYRGKAILHAFYLYEYDSAINILQNLAKRPRVDRKTKAKSKLDLGDIYLLIDEPWESTLLYSQVEKENKSSTIGYEAKLRNAKLNYYTGNFDLAKGHLDILKQATTKEIANDAIFLSLLIKDNTMMDSSEYVMKEYAAIELLQFQNKNDEAKNAYEEMLVKYTGHSIVDEIHWQIANLELKQGNFQNAINHLQIIYKQHGQDILGDDALFLMADINENQLGNKDAAMEMYREFLTTYPGSVYVSDARKRFRKMRGDQI
ncbi:tetratricopeptide repeat protein [Reichenbachiella versicolor]|uniref:tetratricopeptide repeat protein n=1 Tax=Reichenbachiella versicolor TaxID=1821036 RepID=UPI000D6E4F75|nr:tetratricopeptide repeat protein [Reichenbachiella versicolor]